MARRPRLTVPAFPHHVIQRRTNRQPIFFVDADDRFVLRCLAKATARYPCRVYAYVLMTNHVHLLVEPQESASLGTKRGRIYFLDYKIGLDRLIRPPSGL